MRKHLAWMTTIICFFHFVGCATIVSGTNQDVVVRSQPAGASVTVDGVASGTTPMVVGLIRNKRHTIQISERGYQSMIQTTKRSFNWWYLGNAIFGGIIGLIVDPATGAIYKIEPNSIQVDLQSDNPKTSHSDLKMSAGDLNLKSTLTREDQLAQIKQELAKARELTQL